MKTRLYAAPAVEGLNIGLCRRKSRYDDYTAYNNYYKLYLL